MVYPTKNSLAWSTQKVLKSEVTSDKLKICVALYCTGKCCWFLQNVAGAPKLCVTTASGFNKVKYIQEAE